MWGNGSPEIRIYESAGKATKQDKLNAIQHTFQNLFKLCGSHLWPKRTSGFCNRWIRPPHSIPLSFVQRS